MLVKGGPGVASLPDPARAGGAVCVFVFCMLKGGMTWCPMPGLGGTLAEGDGSSTIHIRWERVAHSFATVWASVLKGVTWKTGYESLPSCTPRSERMTEMKWMHEDERRGIAEVSVRS